MKRGSERDALVLILKTLIAGYKERSAGIPPDEVRCSDPQTYAVPTQ
jgi:hypothetical protein